MKTFIDGSGSLEGAIENSHRLWGLIRITRLEASVPGIPEETRQMLADRAERYKARVLEIDAAIRDFRGH